MTRRVILMWYVAIAVFWIPVLGAFWLLGSCLYLMARLADWIFTLDRLRQPTSARLRR